MVKIHAKQFRAFGFHYPPKLSRKQKIAYRKGNFVYEDGIRTGERRGGVEIRLSSEMA